MNFDQAAGHLNLPHNANPAGLQDDDARGHIDEFMRLYPYGDGGVSRLLVNWVSQSSIIFLH